MTGEIILTTASIFDYLPQPTGVATGEIIDDMYILIIGAFAGLARGLNDFYIDEKDKSFSCMEVLSRILTGAVIAFATAEAVRVAGGMDYTWFAAVVGAWVGSEFMTILKEKLEGYLKQDKLESNHSEVQSIQSTQTYSSEPVTYTSSLP